MSDKKIDSILDNFLGKEVDENQVQEVKESSKKIISKSNEIIEHVDKKLITEDGRELLV